MRRSSLKWIIGSSIFLGFIFFVFIFYFSWKDYTGYFHVRHGALAKVVDVKDSIEGKHWITLYNSEGFRVDGGLLVPLSGKGTSKGIRMPAIILLGGKATGKYAINYALDIDSIIILALDYPYEPRQSYTFWTIVYDIPAMRKALIDMVPSSLLVLDYLFERPDVDTTKIVLLGYSFGAPFVPVLSSLDKRFAVASMVYGGGDLTSLIRHNVRRFEGAWLSEFVAQAGGLFLHPIEPMRYVDKISPIQLLMINGLHDEQVPRRNTELFYNAAKEPKAIVWLDSQHVNPNNPELTRRIIAVLKRELRQFGILK